MNKPIFSVRDRFKGIDPDKGEEKSSDIDQEQNLFDFFNLNSEVILPHGTRINTDYNVSYVNEDNSEIVTKCEHELVDVGFMTPKYVCKKCDKEI